MKKIPFQLRDLTSIAFLRQILGDQIGENESALHFLLSTTGDSGILGGPGRLLL